MIFLSNTNLCTFASLYWRSCLWWRDITSYYILFWKESINQVKVKTICGRRCRLIVFSSLFLCRSLVIAVIIGKSFLVFMLLVMGDRIKGWMVFFWNALATRQSFASQIASAFFTFCLRVENQQEMTAEMSNFPSMRHHTDRLFVSNHRQLVAKTIWDSPKSPLWSVPCALTLGYFPSNEVEWQATMAKDGGK